MKRKMIILLALLTAIATCAAAESFMETYTLGDRAVHNEWFECEVFRGKLPGSMLPVFDALLREDDEIICGADFVAHLYSEPDMDWGAQALIAVRREGRILLMGARRVEGEWHAVLETDSFLDPQAEFDITIQSIGIGEEAFHGASLAIVTDSGTYRIEIYPSGASHLREFRMEQADGTTLTIDNYAGFSVDTIGAPELKYEYFKCPAPGRLAAWIEKDFPKSVEEIKAWIAAHPVELDEDEAYISGVNLREKPTSASLSMGEYSAKVTVLGSEPGLQVPWYHVRVGDTEGWVSGNYLVRKGDKDVRFEGAASGFFSVARADAEISLRNAPEGKTKQTIPAGTQMHVIEENDGWLHVVIPRSEITWAIDWDGTYGFVKASEVMQGATLTELEWK